MKKINIVYEDKYMIIVNKPSGLLTIATEKEKNKTMYHEVLEYVKKKNQKLFIIHRLDKDTSGLIIFSKDIKIKNYFQNNWPNVVRKYIAIVEGNVKEEDRIIKSYLKETKSLLTYSSKDTNGKLAITKYHKIKSNDLYSMLEIEILTGRKNQIRVHMKDIGNPIIGDKKYGSKKSPINRLGLCANEIKFIHPVYKKEISLKIDLPKEFLKLF